MPAQDREFRVFGKSIFEAVGEPIGHAVAHDHNAVRSRGVGLLLRARSGSVIRRFLPLPRDRRMLRMPRADGIAEGVERSRDALLLWLLLRPAPSAPITPSPQN
jgi:hypothetical protein